MMSKSSVFTGAMWASVQRFGTMIISFVANMILARLLTPEDFGTVGMLLFFLAISSTFIDSGFGSALIQKANLTEKDNSTVFYINIVMSGFLYIILYILAPFIAEFYSISELTILLRIEGLVLFFNAFGLVQTTLLRKQLNFKQLSNCNLLGNSIGAVIGIFCAYIGLGVWSLVARLLVSSLMITVLLWIKSNWYPKERFCYNSFRELFSFGGFMLLSSLTLTITNNLQTIIIGKTFNANALGNYTQANTLRSYMSDSFSSVVGQVIYPDFANHQNEDLFIRERLLLGVDVLSYITGAIMACCVLVAEPLITILYGTKWIFAIPYFKILCVGGIALSVQDINYHLIAAKGKSKQLFIINCLKTAIYLLMLLGSALTFDVTGVLWAIVIYNFIAYIAYAYLSSYYAKCSFFKQLLVFIKNIIIVLIPFIIVNVVTQYIVIEHNILKLIIGIIGYIVILLVISVVFKLKSFNYLIYNVRRINK